MIGAALSSFFGQHWPDLLVLAVLAYYCYDGFRRGAANIAFDVAGLFVSLLLAFLLHTHVGTLYVLYAGLSLQFAGALGFLTVWLTVEVAYPHLAGPLYARIPITFRASRLNRAIGLALGAMNSALVVAFVFSLLLSLPFPASVKKEVSRSTVGTYVVGRVSRIETAFDGVFGGAVRESLTFLTVHPQSDERVELGFRTNAFAPDLEAEAKLFDLVNKERTSKGLRPLVADQSIVAVARGHSADMLENGYFSHINLKGWDPVERASFAGVRFSVYGENLAFAPDVDIAHDGLMNSPGHRANILSPVFGRIGIGIQDAGIYGLMIAQNFAD